MHDIDPEEFARLLPYMSEADKAEIDELLTDGVPTANTRWSHQESPSDHQRSRGN
jgi:hypothetical protein